MLLNGKKLPNNQVLQQQNYLRKQKCEETEMAHSSQQVKQNSFNKGEKTAKYRSSLIKEFEEKHPSQQEELKYRIKNDLHQVWNQDKIKPKELRILDPLHKMYSCFL